MDLRVKTSGARPKCVEPIRLLQLSLALDSMLADKTDVDQTLNEPICRFAHQGRPRVG
jgi:hypothetical protein